MQRSILLATVGLLVSSPGTLLAARNNPNVTLRLAAQQTIEPAEVFLGADQLERPLALRVRDGRTHADPAGIGTRTDDDDRSHALKATSDVPTFVEEAARQVLGEWGVRIDPGASVVLEITLLTFRVVETNQAVGATFNSEVRLGGEVQDRSGQSLGSASSTGDATRYGKKFSNDNVNEVLSDALLEALAALVSDAAVRDAWSGRASPGAATAGPQRAATGEVISPTALLVEVEALMREGLSSETIRSFVSQRTLSQALGADDLAAWKKAGVPETVIQAALACVVQ